MLKGIRFVLVLIMVLFIVACSKFDRIVKSSDYELKYTKAIEYFEKGNFLNAMTLLEELIPVYKGTERAEKVYYYYAYCNYNLGDYGLAAYHLKNFVRNFPNSEHAEECAFLNAYCYYINSPVFSLDQEDTKTAIAELQQFTNDYPASQRLDSCNKIMDKLRAKLEKKAYSITKQYYQIQEWKSAITEAGNFINDFPESSHQEEVHYIMIRSYYQLAINSIESKKMERIDKTIENYFKFINLYPQSKYLKEVESYYDNCLRIKNTVNQ